MPLTIHKLSTHCRASRDSERHGALVEETARGSLASELNGQIGPSLDRLPSVIRLKELRVRVRIPARNLTASALAGAWAREFTLALHRALAYPEGDGVISSRRHESAAAYKAAMIHHIATKGTAPCWEFPELEEWRGSFPAEAALSVLIEYPVSIAEVIGQLDRNGWLEPLLAWWDEVSLERVMQAASSSFRGSHELGLESLLEIGRAAAHGLRPEWAFSGRRQAIRLWVRLESRHPLRGVWHGLRLLLRFLEVPAMLALRDPAFLADRIPFPAWCEDIVSAAAWSAATHPSARAISADGSAAFVSVLEDLRPLARSAAGSATTIPGPQGSKRAGTSVHWIVSDCAGMLLMLSVVERLNLWRFAQAPELSRFGGERALSFFLAGIGMTLLKPWRFSDPVDPAVALFAGIFSEIDVAEMRRFYSNAGVGAVAEFVRAEAWEQALDLAATELARSFAGRVRGFRQASREAVVKQFIRLRGRVLVERSRLLVVLAPTPWAVALHLSGMDESLGPVERMEYRRVEFVLEGL